MKKLNELNAATEILGDKYYFTYPNTQTITSNSDYRENKV